MNTSRTGVKSQNVDFSFAVHFTLQQNMPETVCNLTWPKFTAACCAEAVKMTIVRYSTSCSLVCKLLGNSADNDNLSSLVHSEVRIHTDKNTYRPEIKGHVALLKSELKKELENY